MTTAAPASAVPIWQGRAQPDELRTWLAVADDVAAALAGDVVERDRANALPVAPLQLLRNSGLANLLVPKHLGGQGAHWATAFAVVRRLARVDASIAQILGYSWLNQACTVFYAQDSTVTESWLRRSAESSWIFADAFNPVSPDLDLVHDGKTYELSGRKAFATGAAVADVLVTGAVAQGGPRDGELLVLALDPQTAGITHLGDWDNVGYRASASGGVAFDHVRVEGAHVIGADTGSPFSTVVTPGVQLLFGNVYVGIAQGALDQARELVLSRKNSWFLSGAERYSEDPVIHRTVGDLVAKTGAAEALADRLGPRFDEAVGRGPSITAEERAGLEVEVAALKVVATDTALEVSSRVFEVTGASSTASRIGLDLHWRNIRTHSLHDPVDYKRIEVGANFLNGTVAPISLYT